MRPLRLTSNEQLMPQKFSKKSKYVTVQWNIIFPIILLAIPLLLISFTLILRTSKIRRPEGFDVIDVESRKGSRSDIFLNNALNYLGGARKTAILDPRSLGLDYEPERVEACKARQEGTANDCELADILTMKPLSLNRMSKRRVSGSTYWKVLQHASSYNKPLNRWHLPNCDLAEEMWTKAANLVKSFSSYRGYSFDHELSASGEEPTWYHRYWENWESSRCHFNSTMLERAIKATSKTTAYVIINYGLIESTDSDIILPKGAHNESHHYDPLDHPPKESFSLVEYGLYQEMRGCAIYDNIEKSYLPIFSALCLRDTLVGPDSSTIKGNHQVVSCSFGEYTGAECVQMLSVKVTETLIRFQKVDDKALMEMI